MIAIVANPLPASPQAWLDLLWILSIKVTLVLAVASLAALALRRASAAARHLIWSVALVGALGLLPLTLWGPGWSIPGLQIPRAVVSETHSQQPESSRLAAVQPATRPNQESTPERTRARKASKSRQAFADGPGSIPAPVSKRKPAFAAAWPIILLSSWFFGVAAMLGTLILGAFGLANLTRRARRVTDRGWLDLLERCRDQLGIRGHVELLAGDRMATPCAWGVLRPRLLIPADADQWPAERRRVVLLHELAHVARHDCLLQALGQLACTLFWFHPLVWLATRRLRVEREHACDDMVLQSDTRASEYADHLLAVVRAMRESRLAAIGAVAFARRSQFEGRLLAVLDSSRARGALTWRRAWPALIAAALVVFPLAALRPWVDPARAGLTLFHGGSRPEEGAASQVLRSSEAEGSFTQRLGWAFAEAPTVRSAKGFWIAYRVPQGVGDDGLLSDSAPLDLSTLDDDWTGPRLSDVIAGRSNRGPRVSSEPRRIVICLHYPRGASRPDAMDRIRVQTEELPAAFEQQPLFWLGDVEDAQSLAWMRSVEDRLTDLPLRSAALDAIAHHGDAGAVRSHLIALLRSDASDELRSTAAERLARFSDRLTIDLLVSTARRDRSAEVREHAIQALGQMDSPEASRVLVELARSSSEPQEVRRAAIESLGQKASDAAAESLDGLAHGEANDRFDGLPDDDVDRIADEAADAATEAREEAEADARADAEDMTDVEDVEDATDRKGLTLDGNVRIVGRPGGQDIEVLGDHGEPEVTIQQRDGKQVIRTHAKEPAHQKKRKQQAEQEEIERQAVESLGQLPESKSLSRLVRIAETHPNEMVRREAVETLGEMGTPRAFQFLKDFVRRENDAEVARQAIEALGNFPEERYGQVLEVLEDLIWKFSDEALQRAAVEVIGGMPEEISLRRLERIARTHPRVMVRRTAIEWIGQADPEKATPILERLIDGDGRP
jgi:beta-lactamase regulating signal transducer with metallopeptidase domain/HEAT repeat protein